MIKWCQGNVLRSELEEVFQKRKTSDMIRVKKTIWRKFFWRKNKKNEVWNWINLVFPSWRFLREKVLLTKIVYLAGLVSSLVRMKIDMKKKAKKISFVEYVTKLKTIFEIVFFYLIGLIRTNLRFLIKNTFDIFWTNHSVLCLRDIYSWILRRKKTNGERWKTFETN